MLLGGAAVLAGLACGTRVAVDIAAKALTPRERIELVEQVQRQYAQPSASKDEDDYVTIKGTIRTYDGKPLPKRLDMSADSYDFMHNVPRSTGKTCIATPPTFSLTIKPGIIWISANFDGYASAIVGPLTGEPGKTFSGVTMVFEKGDPRTICVADESGRPVAGATVRSSMSINWQYFNLGEYRTNKTGEFVLLVPPEAALYQWSFDLSKPGFQSCSESVAELQAGATTPLTLPHAKPLTGEVLSPAGQPVAGIKVRQYAKMNSGRSQSGGPSGPVLAVTDAQGRFTLDTLEDGTSYFLVAESAEFGRQWIRISTPRTERVSIRFGPLLTVSGVIRGRLDMLETDDGKPSVAFSQDTQDMQLSYKGGEFSFNYLGHACVESIKGEQRFTIRGLLPGEVEITPGRHSVRTTVDANTPHQEVTIDLTQPARVHRPVIFRLKSPDGPPPKGTICVNSRPTPGVLNADDEEAVPINGGEARVDGCVGSRIDYRASGLVGYWFPEGGMYVGPGREPLVIELPLVPAGAIAGRVIEADGSPCNQHNVEISLYGCKEVQTPNGLTTQSGPLGTTPSTGSIKVDSRGKFVISPVPLGGEYLVTARRGHTVCRIVAELTEAKPTAQTTLTMPHTTVVNVIVLDPTGRPLAVPLKLEFQPKIESLDGENGPGYVAWGDETDRQGRFRYNDLGVGVGDYFLEVKPERDFQPCRVPLPLDGKPIEVRLKPLGRR